MSGPRGHHLLPQTYQRGFANAKDQVRIVERATGRSYVVSIRDAFKRRDWNAVEDEDGDLDHTAERLLADHIDAPASPGLQQLRAGDLDLEPADRVGVGVFIAAQMGRTQYMRESLGEFEARVLQQTLALAAQHYSDERWQEITGEVPSAEMRDRIARGEGFEISVDKAELFVVQEVAHDLGPMVASMSWLLLEFEEPCLLSSSHPVILLAERPATADDGARTGHRRCDLRALVADTCSRREANIGARSGPCGEPGSCAQAELPGAHRAAERPAPRGSGGRHASTARDA